MLLDFFINFFDSLYYTSDSSCRSDLYEHCVLIVESFHPDFLGDLDKEALIFYLINLFCCSD